MVKIAVDRGFDWYDRHYTAGKEYELCDELFEQFQRSGYGDWGYWHIVESRPGELAANQKPPAVVPVVEEKKSGRPKKR
jgi:hypothetical protein